MTKSEKIKIALKKYYVKNKSHNYKGITDTKSYCLVCNKKISWHAKKCNSHANLGRKYSEKINSKKGLRLNKHPNWKGGLPKCLNCDRTLSRRESKRCYSCSKRFSNNPRFIDGRTGLRKSIYNLKNTSIWRKQILERDKYTCQNCGKIGGKLQVDHNIKQFSQILMEFLICYSDLCPIEDKKELINNAIKYSDFWDIKNGQTLCKSCHRNKKVDFSFSRRKIKST